MKKLAVILVLFFTVFGNAQVDGDQKIGLVLSGGGAKGFAHIGVLKVIDSLGLKVDYIAGTSMGAVIGALYASGYTGKQLDSIFNSVDFDRLINDRIPRNDKSFFARRNEERYAVSLPFDDFKVQLPSAISRGQNVFNLLSKLTLHVSGTESFEELPIPFFCIATDIETGEAVILDKGSLPKAIVASGAFPSLFQPVKIDGRLLIDGGVVNNYPIDELKSKGMDIIVGVDVQDDLADREQLESATGILLQINNFRTIRDMVTKSKQTDIYIKPDIEEFTVISFSEGSKIIENGKIAALKKIPELKQLAVRQVDTGVFNKVPKAADSIKIRNIILSGRGGYPRSYVLGKLKIKENEKISLQDFERGINRLVATDNFESLQYAFNPVAEAFDLRMDATRSENSASIKLAVHYDDLYKSAALINFSKKRLLFSNDALALDFILGDNVRYNFDYFLDKGFYWSIGVHSRFNTFHKNINPLLLLGQEEVDMAGLNRIDVELSDFTNRIYLQTLFRRDFSFLLGGEHKRLKITSETLAEGEDLTEERERTFEKSDFFSLFAGLKFDTFSNKYFPKKGFLFDGDVHWYLTSSDFNNNFSPFAIAKADIAYVIKFSSKFSTRIGSSGGFKLGEDSNNSLNFALGGYGNDLINNFIPFLGYDFISITGNSYVKGYIDLDLEWLPKNHILLSANFSNTGDDIFEDGEWFTDPDFTGYALGYGIESFLGPLEVKYSWSPETESGIWFFNLGFWF